MKSLDMTRAARFGGQGLLPAEAGRPGQSLLCLVLLFAGCDRGADTSASRPTVPPGPCTIGGVVRFSGPLPDEPAPEGECCPGVPRPADEAVVVNPDGTLRNVIVFVRDGPNVATTRPDMAVLAQVGCRYVPHVLALRAGQKLVVTSHDPTTHNVHIFPSAAGNAADNFAESLNGSHTVTFDAADDRVDFKCDVHPWMRARAMVFDHPCYAVTGDDGSFRIDHLPPGTYTVVARHERFGDLEQTVTVAAAAPADVRFDYHP